MATAQRKPILRDIDYPSGDGKPMAETEVHLWVMIDLIQALAEHFAADPMVYVGGDLLLYYQEGDMRKHLAPDVFVVRGVPKLPARRNYLMWREGKGPDVVIEVTSASTMENDRTTKLDLYRDVLKVPEYFQFDPTEDYLSPALQGFRLRRGAYHSIKPVAGRLPSEVLGLHLEQQGTSLRLYNATEGVRLPTRAEVSARAEAEAARAEAEAARAQAAEALVRVESVRAVEAEAEVDRLRREVEELRHRLAGGG